MQARLLRAVFRGTKVRTKRDQGSSIAARNPTRRRTINFISKRILSRQLENEPHSTHCHRLLKQFVGERIIVLMV